MRKIKKSDLARQLIRQSKEEIAQQELVDMMLSDEPVQKPEAEPFGQRAADRVAAFVGSWLFILAFTGLLTGWIILNLTFLKHPYDPYPFILLNLVLSCVAAIQAPLIMMSQNRQDAKDRKRAENDYKINMKTELILEELHHKIDAFIQKQSSEEPSRTDKDL